MSNSPESNLGKTRTPAHPSRPNAVSPNNPATTKPGRSPGGKTGAPAKPKVFAPIPAWGTNGRIGGVFGEQRPGHIHMGLDVDVPIGSRCVAPTDGHIGKYAVTSNFAPSEGPRGGGGMIHFVFDNGTVIGWGHVFECYVKPGEKVTAGQLLGKSGGTNGGAHVHFIQRADSNGEDGSVDPEPLFRKLQKGDATAIDGAPGGASGGSGSGGTDPTSVAKAAALSTFIELPGILNTVESNSLAGQKSLMNDQPLLPFIQQLASASLREFQSMPNGNFYAFFPDYFGGLSHRTAYWEIDDVEIIDGSIQLSDDPLATHVYVVGDTNPAFGSIDLQDKLMSSGVVTIFNAFSANFITGVNSIQKKRLQSQDTNQGGTTFSNPFTFGPGTGSGPGVSMVENNIDIATDAIVDSVATFGEKEGALKFLQKYGARPHYEEAPMIRSPYYELFLAYERFMMMWAQQFLTTFTFTFMPELFPGGIVAFPNHGIQCYVAEVSHNFDYETGFTTSANLMAPSAFATADRTNVHEGMIRAFSLDETAFDPFAEAQAKRDKNKKK